MKIAKCPRQFKFLTFRANFGNFLKLSNFSFGVHMKISILLTLLIPLAQLLAGGPAKLGRLLERQYSQLRDDDQSVVMIYLSDKGAMHKTDAHSLLSERSIARRLKVRALANVVDEGDLPLERSYVGTIAENVIAMRHELKWFNAISAVATKRQIDILRSLPFVKEIDLVGRWKKNPELENLGKAPATPPAASSALSLDYGPSFTQNNQINVPAVHNFGIYGQGIVICMLDNGVRLQTHEAFASMNIIAQHDFVDHKESVVPNNPSSAFGSHGVNTLSAIGGYKPGQLIGPAFKASFILARTENDSSETPIEEDNWAAAIQWADSIGADVSSTSLGYCAPGSPYDPPYTSWTQADMDGNTTVITKAADHAVQLGIVVLNSAGNSGGGDGVHNTLGAPADGDSVITVGAVGSTGTRTGFSSVGPTADGRIKPDIMALGSGDYLASSTNPTGYGSGSGTSFSCPLSAGAAALVLCANPSLTPIQVRQALRQTANNASAPNNLVGWGIINTLSAIRYYGATANCALRGSRFNDRNGNGIWDGGEPPLSGAQVILSGFVSETTYTDINGHYSFFPLQFGIYTIRGVLPAGWVRTSPADSFNVALNFGSDSGGFDFGSFRLGSITGHKYNDTNRNGIYDTLDFPLADWKMHIAGPVPADVLTDSSGTFTFTGVGPGTYVLSESAKANWVQSYPPGNATYTIVMRSGLDTAGFVFLNYFDSVDNYFVPAGWNLLSLPQDPSTHLKISLYPSAISKAFIYDHAYKTIDTIPNGVGYWIKFANPQNILIEGAARVSDTVPVVQGWNMIGSLSAPIGVGTIQQNPPGSVSSNYFRYGGSYIIADSLRPHVGYWVKSKNSAELIMNYSANAPTVGRTDGEWYDRLTVSDEGGASQTLYFTADKSAAGRVEFYSVPPLPPEGGFDVRFSNGSMLGVLDGKELPLLLGSVKYPLRITWDAGLTSQAELRAGGNSWPLRGTGSANIREARDLRIGATRVQLPEKFALEQNFPNPFNPSTVIRYELPVSARVLLKIYNVFGQEVAKLVDGDESAGYHTKEFDARNIASGVYFYRLTARDDVKGISFTRIRKMVLLK